MTGGYISQAYQAVCKAHEGVDANVGVPEVGTAQAAVSSKLTPPPTHIEETLCMDLFEQNRQQAALQQIEMDLMNLVVFHL